MARLAVIFAHKRLGIIGVSRKDDIEFKPSKQLSAVVDHDARQLIHFCISDSNFVESMTFHRILPWLRDRSVSWQQCPPSPEMLERSSCSHRCNHEARIFIISWERLAVFTDTALVEEQFHNSIVYGRISPRVKEEMFTTTTSARLS